MLGYGREKIVLGISIMFVLGMIMKRGNQERTYEVFLVGHKPNDVYDTLVNFENIAKLNKRIVSWEPGKEITSKDGVWRYLVTSHETMAGQLLFGLNVNQGDITCKVVKKDELYTITSKFMTNSFRGLLTIENASTVRVSLVSRDGEWGVLYQERVTMDCPVLLGAMCTGETDANRRDFISNLKMTFH